MYTLYKQGPQAEYCEKANQRVQASPTLAARYPTLKVLAVDLIFHNTLTPAYDRHIKYIVNLANAKSVFRVQCSTDECVRGDFDLTDDLAKAVVQRHKAVSGKCSCLGWSSACMNNKVQCHNVLQYQLTLGY